MGSILDISEKRVGGGGEGVSTPEGLCMSQVSYILPISSSKVAYKVVASSGVRGNYKLFSPHDF